jgi:hypothetical protein
MAWNLQKMGREIRESYQYICRLAGVGICYHRIEEMSMSFAANSAPILNPPHRTIAPAIPHKIQA